MNLGCPLFAPKPRIARTFERIMTRHGIQINEQLNDSTRHPDSQVRMHKQINKTEWIVLISIQLEINLAC